MKKYIYNIFSLLSMLFLFSCTDVLEEEYTGECPTNEIADGDFVISMNIPSLNVSSRTIDGDPENGANSWSTWEKYCDGALLYRVTIFVVDGDGTLVGYRDFYSGSNDIKAENSEYGGNGFYENNAVNTSLSNGIAVKATFKANNPMHGTIEKLQATTYKVYAVANYAPINTTNAATVGVTTGETYLGLGLAKADTDTNSSILNGESSGSTNDFTSIVNSIITGFNQSTGIVDFDDNTDFFNYKLNAGTDRVCKIQPQPLVMIRSVDLSQTNQLSGELARTFARIRLTVQNVNTGTAQIGISQLAFNEAYASQKAFLFNDVGTTSTLNLHNHFDLYESTTEPTNTELNTKGLLNVSSDDAIIDFDSDEGYRLIPGTNRTIFDCYLLEGMIANSNAFSFTATYWTSATGGSATENITIQNWNKFLYDDNGYHRQVFIRKDISNSQYLLEANNTYNTSGYVTGGYIDLSDEEQEYAVDNAEGALDPIYIWEVQPTPETPSGYTTYGELFSIGTGLYLQPYDGNESGIVKLGFNTTGGKILFNINFDSNTRDELGSIYCVYNGSYYYISSAGKWVNSNISATDGTTSPPSSDTSYERLTFETIAGVAGEEIDKTISKTIEMSAETTTGNNKVVRNDFFWGTIPLYINEQNLGVSLSAYELTWYVGDEATAKSVTVTTRDTGLSWDLENNQSNFTVVKNDDGTITVTPTSTANAVTNTITVTCSNGDEVTLNLVVKERPAAITKSITLSFVYGNNEIQITNGNVTETTGIGTLTHNGNGSYTFVFTYTEEVLDNNITFSYVRNNRTYTNTMTLQDFINNYGNGGIITLTS